MGFWFGLIRSIYEIGSLRVLLKLTMDAGCVCKVRDVRSLLSIRAMTNEPIP